MRPGQVRRGGIGAGVALVALLVGAVVGNVSPAGATHAGVLELDHLNFEVNPTSLENDGDLDDGTALYLYASHTDATTIQDGLQSSGFDEGDGVEGIAVNDGNGVFGHTASPISSGVYGQNDGTGFGVASRANSGTGVLAESTNGTALNVVGVAKFSRSGLAVAGAGQTARGVTGVSLTSSSLVLTTIQGNNTANIYVTRVVTIPSQSKFIIYFNQALPAGTVLKIAWFVLN
jgi:hypothetical protein